MPYNSKYYNRTTKKLKHGQEGGRPLTEDDEDDEDEYDAAAAEAMFRAMADEDDEDYREPSREDQAMQNIREFITYLEISDIGNMDLDQQKELIQEKMATVVRDNIPILRNSSDEGHQSVADIFEQNYRRLLEQIEEKNKALYIAAVSRGTPRRKDPRLTQAKTKKKGRKTRKRIIRKRKTRKRKKGKTSKGRRKRKSASKKSRRLRVKKKIMIGGIPTPPPNNIPSGSKVKFIDKATDIQNPTEREGWIMRRELQLNDSIIAGQILGAGIIYYICTPKDDFRAAVSRGDVPWYSTPRTSRQQFYDRHYGDCWVHFVEPTNITMLIYKHHEGNWVQIHDKPDSREFYTNAPTTEDWWEIYPEGEEEQLAPWQLYP